MKTWAVAIEDIKKIPEKVVRGTTIGMFSKIVKRSPTCLLYTSPSPRDRG